MSSFSFTFCSATKDLEVLKELEGDTARRAHLDWPKGKTIVYDITQNN